MTDPKPNRRSLAGRAALLAERFVRAAVSELRRSRRVVVVAEPEADSESAARPIFVIGVHRSGTTLVRLILDSHSRIACPPESFFVRALAPLLEDARGMEGLEAMGFPGDAVVARTRRFVSSFFELYAASHGKARWADKTPSYVDCLELLDRLYGARAQYVLVYRHGLDSACSTAKIPDIAEAQPHVDACGGDRHAGCARYWAAQVRKMRAFAQSHPERCHELLYERLCADPEPACRALFEFLGEPWEEGVLRFHERGHDSWRGLEDFKAMESKGFKARSGVWREQPRAVVAAMFEQAGTELAGLGYDDVREYLSEGA